MALTVSHQSYHEGPTLLSSGILPPGHKKVLVGLCYATSVVLATGWREFRSTVFMIMSYWVVKGSRKYSLAEYRPALR